jgi:glycosyltransferase involved in cell wall biosynthesis
VLYLADIQGPKLISARGIVRNLSYAGTTKVFSICQSILMGGHQIYIYSPGSPAERTGRYYPKISENITNEYGNIYIEYGASIDDRICRFLFSIYWAVINITKLIRKYSITLVIIYNLSTVNVISALIARFLGCKVILEYEDSVVASRGSRPSFAKFFFLSFEFLAKKIISGVMAASEELGHRIGISHTVIVPGILDQETTQAASKHPKNIWTSGRSLRLIYAGGMDQSKGIDRFLRALKDVRFNFLVELEVCGHGPMSMEVSKLAQQQLPNVEIRFIGSVSREQLINRLCWADVGINPHRSDIHNGGSWPFKVAEYLALCGTVFSNKTNKINSDLQSRLWEYDCNESELIAKAFQDFLDSWPEISQYSDERRRWALSAFSSEAFSVKINSFLENSF